MVILISKHIVGIDIDVEIRYYINVLLSSIVFFYGGFPFFKGIINEMKLKKPGMMSLVSLGITISYFYSIANFIFGIKKDLFIEMVTLIDVMLLGHYLEAKSIESSSNALNSIAKLIPQNVHVIKGKAIKGKENIKEIPINDLKVNDLVLIKPWERIPADGVVIFGTSYVDESLLTGESKPVKKSKKDVVIAGSMNREGSIIVKVMKSGNETYLGKVIDILKEAQSSKYEMQDLANKVAGFLFYVAIIAGITAYVLWYLKGLPDIAIERAVASIVIACPHALGLAIPLVIAISNARAAMKGILIKNKRAFEELKDFKAVIFDKTGTLTKGSFQVVGIESRLKNKKEILKIAYSLERFSEHLIAKTIEQEARKQHLNFLMFLVLNQ
jgi:Cu2+-exporting ATPase